MTIIATLLPFANSAMMIKIFPFVSFVDVGFVLANGTSKSFYCVTDVMKSITFIVWIHPCRRHPRRHRGIVHLVPKKRPLLESTRQGELR